MASMATPDSGDSNLPKESSNEICDIINCVAIYYEKGASGNAFLWKEKFRAQVSRKVRSLKALRETVRYVYFNTLFVVDYLDLLSAFSVRSMRNTIFAACGRPPRWLTKPYNIFAEMRPS